MASLRIIVRGWVQGVGFRAYTQRSARALGIAGEVWNRRDGGVECIAEHEDEAQLRAFTERLREGPGQVDEVIVRAEAAPGPLRDFVVGRTR